MSHTPGPWRVLDLRPSDECISISCNSGIVCRVSNLVSKNPLTDEDAANARLIAAAPELLRELKNLVEAVEFVDPGVYCLDEMKAAISKAEGATS